MANNIPLQMKKAIIRALLDGMSIRQIEALTEVHRDRITTLIHRIGDHCKVFLHDTVDTEGGELPPLCVEHLEINIHEKQQYKTFLDKLDKEPSPTAHLNVVVVMSFVTKAVIHYLIVEDDAVDTIYKFLKKLDSSFVAPYVNSHDFKHYVEDHGIGGDIAVETLVDYLTGLQEIAPLGYPKREEAWKRVNTYTGLGTLSLFKENNTAFPRSIKTLDAVVAIYLVYYNYLRVHPLLDSTPAVAARSSEKVGDFRFTHMLASEFSDEEFEEWSESIGEGWGEDEDEEVDEDLEYEYEEDEEVDEDVDDIFDEYEEVEEVDEDYGEWLDEHLEERQKQRREAKRKIETCAWLETMPTLFDKEVKMHAVIEVLQEKFGFDIGYGPNYVVWKNLLTNWLNKERAHGRIVMTNRRQGLYKNTGPVAQSVEQPAHNRKELDRNQSGPPQKT